MFTDGIYCLQVRQEERERACELMNTDSPGTVQVRQASAQRRPGKKFVEALAGDHARPADHAAQCYTPDKVREHSEEDQTLKTCAEN